jgi:cell division protein FtsI/penicillin-binding protein 2
VASISRSPGTRLFLLGAFFLGCACLLSYRLYSYQYLEHDRYRRLASDEHRKTITIQPRRGALLDANGLPLAVSVEFDAVAVVGKEVHDREATARALAPVIGMPPAEILAKIDPESDRSVILKDRLPASVADSVEALELRGTYLEPRPVRQYPEGSIAAQILGFVGKDNDGLTGLEYYFDEQLAGRPGTIDTELDTTGQQMIFARRVVGYPRDGADIVLSLDRFAQRVAERELAEGVRQNKGIGGMIIVMEPSTGAVLAMASWPTYTLSDAIAFKPEEQHLYKAVPVTNQYEPGSVMKVVTMAAGLDRGVVTPTTTVNDTGIAQYGPLAIRNWDHRANGVISMTEVLVRSSNIGAQWVANKVGPTEMYRYLSGFGFGEPTGIELPGEVPGTMRTPTTSGWAPVDVATNSFGQGIAVTPIQMLAAVAAIGNDGMLMRPTLVKQFVVDGRVQRPEPHAVRQVVAPQTARTLRTMMVTVLEQPALQPHRVPGYRLAGKTGTADFPTNLGYTSGKTFASVVALAPADQPRLAILVRIDAPEAIYGGTVAAPILKRVAEELLAYYRIPASSPTLASGR